MLKLPKLSFAQSADKVGCTYLFSFFLLSKYFFSNIVTIIIIVQKPCCKNIRQSFFLSKISVELISSNALIK